MSINWDKVWVAVSQSGGGGASFMVGGGVYFLPFVNVGNPRKIILTCVTCKRLGVAIHAGASHAIGIMLGVGSTSDMNGLTGGGYDFAVDLGAKWGQLVKQGGRIGKWLQIIEAAFKGLSAGVRSGLASGAEIAFSEASKGLVNAFAGNFDLDEKKRGFYMFGTPIGVGIGAGVWYEWQTVWTLGGPKAWDYGTPKWRMLPSRGGLYLQMKGIPEPNGTKLKVHGLRAAEWGSDPYLDFGTPNARGGFNIAKLEGVSQGYKFVGDPADARAPADGGINIARNEFDGMYEYFGGFIQGRGIRSRKFDARNTTIEIGLDIKAHDKVVWQSDQYVKVKTDANERIRAVVDAYTWKS